MALLPFAETASPVLAKSPLVEWHRVDISRRVRGALALGGGTLLSGMFFSCVWFLYDVPIVMRVVSGSVGVVLVVVGALIAFGRLARILLEDHYVAAYVESLVVQLPGQREVVPWDSIARVRNREDEAVMLELRDGGEVKIDARFADIDGATLARRLEDCRRRASFGLLRTADPRP
jgi:hypothetical protein